jgi:hypothetical protein
MAKEKKRGGGKRKTSKRRAATVTVRYANEGSMSKTKNPRRGGKRSHHGKRRGNPRRRRRSNPSGFMERAGRLLGLAAVAVGTGVGVTWAASKIMPGTNTSLYGIPILTFLAGAAISQKMPTLGVGIAAGSAAPFVVPLTTKLLTATAPATPTTPATTAAGIARAYRGMRAIDMGHGRMGAIDMGAIDMGRYVAYR